MSYKIVPVKINEWNAVNKIYYWRDAFLDTQRSSNLFRAEQKDGYKLYVRCR